MPSHSSLTSLLSDAYPPHWRVDSDPPAQRLWDCLVQRDETERLAICEEVEKILGRGLCDVQVSDLIAYELGCHLRPAEMGMTPSGWLAWIGGLAVSGSGWPP